MSNQVQIKLSSSRKAELRSAVQRGEKLPDFLFPFLSREFLQELVGVARSANALAFLEQLQSVLTKPKSDKPQLRSPARPVAPRPTIARKKKKKTKKLPRRKSRGAPMFGPDNYAADRYFEQRATYGGEGVSIRACSGGLPSLGKRK